MSTTTSTVGRLLVVVSWFVVVRFVDKVDGAIHVLQETIVPNLLGVKYIQEYVRAPAVIDLSNVTFIIKDPSFDDIIKATYTHKQQHLSNHKNEADYDDVIETNYEHYIKHQSKYKDSASTQSTFNKNSNYASFTKFLQRKKNNDDTGDHPDYSEKDDIENSADDNDKDNNKDIDDALLHKPNTVDNDEIYYSDDEYMAFEDFIHHHTNDMIGTDEIPPTNNNNKQTNIKHPSHRRGGVLRRPQLVRRRTLVGNSADESDQRLLSSSSLSKSSNTQHHYQIPTLSNDGGVEVNATFLDIVIVPIPKSCSYYPSKCKWSSIGIGKKRTYYTSTEDDEERSTSNTKHVSTKSDKTTSKKNDIVHTVDYLCCTDETIQLGYCTMDQKGRLLLDAKLFRGQHKSISISQQGYVQKQLGSSAIVPIRKSNRYAIVFANCNNPYRNGRPVDITGSIQYKSNHGYLPGELYRYTYINNVVLVLYIALVGWFTARMVYYTKYTIPIEYYILATIIIGLTEGLFRTVDFSVWNHTGVRNWILFWSGTIVGIIKDGISRCLLVMVAMGWTMMIIIKPSLTDKASATTNRWCSVTVTGLSSSQVFVVALSIVYSLVELVSAIMVAVRNDQVHTLSTTVTTMHEIFTVHHSGIFVRTIRCCLNILFFVLILLSILATKQHFHRTNDTKKYQRIQYLSYILLGSAMLGLANIVIGCLDYYHTEYLPNRPTTTTTTTKLTPSGLQHEEYVWVQDALSHINYIYVLIGIAVLWRPSCTSHDYTYKKLDNSNDYDDDNDHDYHTSNTIIFSSKNDAGTVATEDVTSSHHGSSHHHIDGGSSSTGTDSSSSSSEYKIKETNNRTIQQDHHHHHHTNVYRYESDGDDDDDDDDDDSLEDEINNFLIQKQKLKNRIGQKQQPKTKSNPTQYPKKLPRRIQVPGV